MNLNPEMETTDYADDTDGQALGATVTFTHWVNDGGGESNPQIFESVQSV